MKASAFTGTEVGTGLTAHGLDVTSDQARRLARFLELLVQWNRVYNLTGIRDPVELLERHLVESLALAPLLRGDSVADIGTGAGLPGLPLAIVCRDRRFTLIESRRKRVNFLRHVAATLELGNVTVAHSRAEHLPCPAPFATVLARAVAPPDELLAIARPLLAPRGRLLLLTSAELGRRIAELATDFKQDPVSPGTALRIASSIVVLDRSE
jgi:16S rRNA (guanine527-N7)-methyltransferase